MADNKNYGIATPLVRILHRLPKVVQESQVYNFDITARHWPAINKSPYVEPLLTEQVQDNNSDFAACFPARKKFFVDNYLSNITPGSSSAGSSLPSADGRISWTPCSLKGVKTPGAIEEKLDSQNFPSYYTDITNKNNTLYREPIDPDTEPGSTYVGPIWNMSNYKEAKTDGTTDDAEIKEFLQNFGASFPAKPIPPGQPDETGTDEQPPEKRTLDCPHQSKVQDGLWWGLESDDFLTENMPFWVTIETSERPPYPAQYETFWIISLGVDSNNNQDRFDLVLSLNELPRLMDYYGNNAFPVQGRVIDHESTRLVTTDKRIDVGFMTIGGRLVVTINNFNYIYTRIVRTGNKDDKGKLKPCNIAKGKIRVYGSNMRASVYAYPMTFARLSAMAFPIVDRKETPVLGDPNNPKIEIIQYSAADETGDPTGEATSLLPSGPQNITKEQQYGIDAESFRDEGINKTVNNIPPTAFGLHREGRALFISVKEFAKKYGDPAIGNLKGTDFFLLFMRPDDKVWDNTTLRYSATPYFFRLKGVDVQARKPRKLSPVGVTEDLIDITEEASAPDFFHIKKSATVVLYNENGKYDALKQRQYGIDIRWTWNADNTSTAKDFTKTFTGVIVSTSTNEVPGKETITLVCEDYNYILQNTPVVNSPFYDGMVGYHAVRDLAKRAGIGSFQKDWVPNIEEYFLPSGYSFTSPRMRFKSTDKIFDCIMTIVKRFEAFTYFDADGTMHIDRLPGGLLGYDKATFGPGVIDHYFSSDPTDVNKTTILDQRDIEVTFDSTANLISIFTLDRDTRNLIAVSTIPKNKDNKILFKKPIMIDQPAYGDIDVARAHMYRLAERVFQPIRGISFKTVGVQQEIATPLQFIDVDDLPYRLTSVRRNYNADSNDFSQEYEARWLNG